MFLMLLLSLRAAAWAIAALMLVRCLPCPHAGMLQIEQGKRVYPNLLMISFVRLR